MQDQPFYILRKSENWLDQTTSDIEVKISGYDIYIDGTQIEMVFVCSNISLE